MSLSGKKARDPSQLPTLCYEVKLNLPGNVDSNPQEISFLDLIANDTKFKNDKESLELVLSSYVKACGKQSVKEILAERDTLVEDNASLSDIIHALMDYNDQQNANLGVGYNDPEDDDSFIDDSRAAQDIIPRNMTNERDGFYVNEKHQPIKARYLSDPSDSDTDDDEEESGDSDDDESSTSEKEEKQNKKSNHENHDDLNEKTAKKSKTDDDITRKLVNTKRKRSISEVAAPPIAVPVNDSNKISKALEEPVKKVQKLSEPPGELSAQNLIAYVLPNEMDNDIKPSIEKLVKLILSDQTISSIQKKIERLFNSKICHELLDLVKKLQRHTNAHRQLVFDILSSKTGICTPILIIRGRLVLLNDYEIVVPSLSLNELKEKLKTEINRSLEFHIEAHNHAVKEWQQKMVENPSKDKNRGPRKNFRLYKIINELIIRCIDRRLETMTIIDLDSLELFLHDHIVSLWEKPGWMTAKKIISEVIRLEYRPLKDTNLSQSQPLQTTRAPPISSPVDRPKKDSQTTPLLPAPPPPLAPKVPTPNVSPTKSPYPQNIKTNDIKPPIHSSPNTNSPKSLEMATRVATNPVKQHSSRLSSTESTTSQSSEQSASKANKSDIIRPVAKPIIVSQSDTPTKCNSAVNFSSVIDLTMDLFPQFKKHSNESVNSTSKQHTHSSSTKDSSTFQRTTTSSTSHSKQQQQQQQQQQFATKLPPEKSPAGSFLKEALLTGSSSPKMSASPLAVDNMLNKSVNSPKSTPAPSITKPSMTQQSPISNTHRASASHKSHSNRPSADFTSHRTDQPIQQQKTSSSSSRSQPSTALSSSSISPVTSRPRTAGYTSTHEQQSNRGISSQVGIPSALAQSIQWDPATLQLAAAALANPQLLNSSVFDPAIFNSVFGSTPNITSSSSSRQQHSQNTNNNRRT